MGKIISVVDFDNSVNASVLAVNLALALGSQLKDRTAFVDAGGSVVNIPEALLGHAAEKTLSDIISLPSGMNAGMLKGYIPHVEGIAVVGGGSLEFMTLSPQTLKNAIIRISEAYPFVIVFTTALSHEHCAAVLEASDLALMPIAANIVSLKMARRFIDLIKTWHFSLSLLKPVLFKPEGIEAHKEDYYTSALGVTPFAEIVYNDTTAQKSINTATPVLKLEPHGKFSNSIKLLAKQLQETTLSDRTDRSDPTDGTDQAVVDKKPDYQTFKKMIHRGLPARLDMKTIDLSSEEKKQAAAEHTRRAIEELLSEIDEKDLPREERPRLINEVLNEALGFGCLEELLNDPAVTEIMVNGRDTIYVEKKGKITLSGLAFTDDSQLRTVLDRIVAPLGRRIDESSPLVDARLPDGSRVNAVIPPIALNGATITIRKFSKKKLAVEDLIQFGALTKEMADFLRLCVLLRKNIVVSGGTGSGKTTLLNVVSSFIPSDERICTIEDSAELKLPQEHVVRLESRPPSTEGTGEVSIRRLVINALRMRPDRVVVGECRGGETLDMLQAMNTGHDGSLTTIHANTPKDGVARITTMVMMAGMDLPEKAIREQIASAVHIIVQLSRMSDGSRKVVDITEINGIKNGEVVFNPLFKFEQTGIHDGNVDGCFVPTGNIPTFMEEAATHGLTLDNNMFAKGKI